MGDNDNILDMITNPRPFRYCNRWFVTPEGKSDIVVSQRLNLGSGGRWLTHTLETCYRSTRLLGGSNPAYPP